MTLISFVYFLSIVTWFSVSESYFILGKNLGPHTHVLESCSIGFVPCNSGRKTNMKKRMGRYSKSVTFKIYRRVVLLLVDMYLSTLILKLAKMLMIILLSFIPAFPRVVFCSTLPYGLTCLIVPLMSWRTACLWLCFNILFSWFFNTTFLSFQKPGNLRLSVFNSVSLLWLLLF